MLPTLERAIVTADSYARRVRGVFPAMLLRRAPWRSKAATERQIGYIGQVFRDPDSLAGVLRRARVAKLEDLTAGQAADMLTALSNGAKREGDRRDIEERKLQRTSARKLKQADAAMTRAERTVRRVAKRTSLALPRSDQI